MDKPYTERMGGSYVRDKETGAIRRADEVQTEAPAKPEGDPAGDSKKKEK